MNLASLRFAARPFRHTPITYKKRLLGSRTNWIPSLRLYMQVDKTCCIMIPGILEMCQPTKHRELVLSAGLAVTQVGQFFGSYVINLSFFLYFRRPDLITGLTS